mmetsp:Transcript_50977/g.69422  ORF Transcript_50977/g.69422 Transcript_50977/m.69422 type:complete len:237 (-) Transcript_50977:626-1336(-)
MLERASSRNQRVFPGSTKATESSSVVSSMRYSMVPSRRMTPCGKVPRRGPWSSGRVTSSGNSSAPTSFFMRAASTTRVAIRTFAQPLPVLLHSSAATPTNTAWLPDWLFSGFASKLAPIVCPGAATMSLTREATSSLETTATSAAVLESSRVWVTILWADPWRGCSRLAPRLAGPVSPPLSSGGMSCESTSFQAPVPRSNTARLWPSASLTTATIRSLSSTVANVSSAKAQGDPAA